MCLPASLVVAFFLFCFAVVLQCTKPFRVIWRRIKFLKNEFSISIVFV